VYRKPRPVCRARHRQAGATLFLALAKPRIVRTIAALRQGAGPSSVAHFGAMQAQAKPASHGSRRGLSSFAPIGAKEAQAKPASHGSRRGLSSFAPIGAKEAQAKPASHGSRRGQPSVCRRLSSSAPFGADGRCAHQAARVARYPCIFAKLTSSHPPPNASCTPRCTSANLLLTRERNSSANRQENTPGGRSKKDRNSARAIL